MKHIKIQLAGVAVILAAMAGQAQSGKIAVDVAHPGHRISPMLWGIFFEDINLSADGGIYPELVRNRSFEDDRQPVYWKIRGATAAIDSRQPLNPFNVHCLRLNVNGPFTLQNDGYWGMNIVAGGRYTLRFAARGDHFDGRLTAKIVNRAGDVLAGGELSRVGNNWQYQTLALTATGGDHFDGRLTAKIVNRAGDVLAGGELSRVGNNWQYQTLALTATGGDPQAHLEISGDGKGALCLDMVSLMPDQTWKEHGLRADLCQALDQLHPAFMRFPGGNWIEGDDLAHMYQWKTTIGPIDSRKPLWNTWGYNTTQGLGFYEYLQLCADLGAEPVFGINCGMSLHGSVPLDQMGRWVQDALDAIEYANGPTNSVWGAKRAAAGHPAPFHLQYLEIGNENGGPDYWQRWKLVAGAIRAKYPDMKLIMTTSLQGYPYPPSPKPDIIDEHYYESPESFMHRAGQYDHYNRQGPKIFVGEYAVTEKSGLGNLRAAIGEAAFMTGMERNSDVVLMASYAPLFVNLNHRAWNPDLINFDSSRWYGIPSYYIQQMFSENRGDVELPVQVESPMVKAPVSQGMIGVGTWNTEAEFKDVQVTAPGGATLFASDFSRNAAGWNELGGGDWSVQGGALQQHDEKEFVRALAGDKSWTNYTLTLKARKLGGREGFLVLFHIVGSEDRVWWNLGGWDNTQDAVEGGSGPVDPKPEHIEAGRWYDLKVVVGGNHVKCFLDGRLVHDVDYDNEAPVKALYACASRDDKTGDVIVKVVNAGAGPLETKLDFTGARGLTGQGSAIVLTSENPTDENTLEDPTRVSPKAENLNLTGTSLTRTFPGNSFTVLRIHSKPAMSNAARL